jgi:hypothetical protein
MKPRSTIFLVTLAVLLFGFIWFFERHQRSAGMAPAPDRILPGLRAEAVTRIQVRPAGRAELLAERTNNVWMLARPVLYPAVGEAIEALVTGLGQITTESRLSGEEVRSHKQPEKEFGFDPPAFSLVLNQGEEVTQVLIGKLIEPLKDGVFVQVVGREGIFLADAALLKLIPKAPDAWRALNLIHLRDLSFDRIAVTNGAKFFELERSSLGGWRLAPPVQARADSARVEALLAQLQGARVGGFVTDTPGADLDSFGLQPAELSVAFWRGTNAVRLLQFGRSLTNDPALIFARNTRWDTVVLAPAEAVAGWRGAVAEFRDRHLVSLAPGQVEAVEFRGPAAFTLERLTNDVWQIAGTNGFAADPALVFDFLSALAAMEVAQLKDVVTPLDFPNYGLEPPARELTLRASPAGRAAADTNGVLAQLAFGTNQAGTVFARRADEKSVYGLRLNDVLRLPAMPWQLRDRQLWRFTENEVARLLVQHGTNSYEILRAGPNQWQVPTNAPAGINDLSLDELAHQLGSFKVLSWMARSEAARAPLGFNTNSPRVTVLLKDGARRTLEFGGASPRGFLLAAAEVDGQPTMFEFPWSLWQALSESLRVPLPRR